jgi:hypothetical protein
MREELKDIRWQSVEITREANFKREKKAGEQRPGYKED